MTNDNVNFRESMGGDSGDSARDGANAQRFFDDLGRRQAARDAQDRSTLIDCLNEGLRLAHEHHLGLGWLVDAAYAYVGDHVWEGTLCPRVPGVKVDSAVPITTAGQALAIALVAVVERQHRHRGGTEAVLRRCLDVALLDGEARDLVAYFHAETTRDLGRVTESEGELRELVVRGARLADTARKGLIHLQRRAGRFRDINADLTGVVPAPVWSRLAGDLWWTQACFERADECYVAARDQAWSCGAVGEAALSEACRGFAAGFGEPGTAERVIESARDLLSAVDITWAGLQVALGELLTTAGADGDFHAKCDEIAVRARSAGLSSSAAYAELARGFHCSVRRDRAGIAVARDALRQHARSGQFGYLLEIVRFCSTGDGGEDGEEDLAVASDWIDGVEITAARWRDTVERRRTYLNRDHA
ncbi:hypothetical protein [Streptomyces sp. NBC_01803]|uniref:hypothetical protein n=1 Tax=Streptomyces sp. NBC_01803 TaxID=2975946 RepID=UPI002DDABEF9|nr:hypothetical protein [Streptomyces sp. NBC_01803]WSA47331.1 hypothetical protein OIE51_26060 [Streptomyces sp. NBC_01803]